MDLPIPGTISFPPLQLKEPPTRSKDGFQHPLVCLSGSLLVRETIVFNEHPVPDTKTQLVVDHIQIGNTVGDRVSLIIPDIEELIEFRGVLLISRKHGGHDEWTRPHPVMEAILPRLAYFPVEVDPVTKPDDVVPPGADGVLEDQPSTYEDCIPLCRRVLHCSAECLR